MPESTSFTEAMQLTPAGTAGEVAQSGVAQSGVARSGVARFTGHLNANWTIGPKVHGGMMLALCANAARTAFAPSAGSQPVAVSANYTWAPDPGDMCVTATLRKRGRRVSLVDVELSQDDRVAVRAAVTLAEPDDGAPLLSANPVITLMPPEPPPGLEPIGPGHPMADVVHLARGLDLRPSLRTLGPRTDGGPPMIEYWVRPKDCAPDLLFALVCGDVSAPVTFGVNRTGWAPTVQLTAYLRGVPADGWLRVLCTTMEIGQEWFDEDHVVVDAAGRIVVQSRQLAMVPAP